MINNFNEHVEKSFLRLSGEEYSIGKIWQKNSYGWAGDWEGRALLAFVRLYQLTGKKIPCMDKLVDELPSKLNERGYMGEVSNGIADEQQLSGHSWLLRGLVSYYRVFSDERALKCAKSVVDGLYLPVIDLYEKYPLNRQGLSGGVSGNITELVDGWKLSSDIGCAYMCLDGLTDYYALTRDENVFQVINRLIDGFSKLDFIEMKVQTHATLSATRGLIRLFEVTQDKKYLNKAVSVFDFYVKHGMTLTFENFNWFGREDTWTEPCAIADSFIVAAKLFKLTENQEYQVLASRIWYNGLSFCHRDNGGAGPNDCVTEDQPYLSVNMFEAAFCCTMRYCEGLYYISKYSDLISTDGTISIDEKGRVFKGNKLLVTDEGGDFPDQPKIVVNGKEYIEIPSFVKNGSYKLRVL